MTPDKIADRLRASRRSFLGWTLAVAGASLLTRPALVHASETCTRGPDLPTQQWGHAVSFHGDQRPREIIASVYWRKASDPAGMWRRSERRVDGDRPAWLDVERDQVETGFSTGVSWKPMRWQGRA